MNIQLIKKTGSALLAAAWLTTSVQADVVAFDLVDSSSQNLVSYTNPWTDAFSSNADGFQIYQRGVSSSIPFQVLDDSLSIFPPDSQGIITEGSTDTFFGVADTVNNDSPGEVSASWLFDVSGYTDLSLSIDVGAMGDFENSDFFDWSVSIDGEPATSIFGSMYEGDLAQSYMMEGGAVIDLNDPLSLNGTLLSNQLQTFTSALIGTGSLLELTLTASTNGNGEAFVFQNIVIEGSAAVSEPSILMLLGIGAALLGFSRRR